MYYNAADRGNRTNRTNRINRTKRTNEHRAALIKFRDMGMYPTLKNKRVLFVEDDKANQYYMQLMLEEIGCSFELAYNGQEAVEKVKREPKFNIIFMDLRMPVMDGFQAADIIRKDIDKTVLIVAVTAHAVSEVKEKCFMVGMNGFIAKGVDVGNFGKELLSWVKKS